VPSPGRFFVAQELKMVVAHMLMNYDIKHIEKRAERSWVGSFPMMDLKASIDVRRKKNA
jgi:hypothetical protein